MKDYKGVIFQGATFPDDSYRTIHVTKNSTILSEYIPAIPTDLSDGMKLLITAMAIQEGFKVGTRSYETHNPGNIGNTDNGVSRVIANLTAGIHLQADFINGIIAGTNHSFPLGYDIHIAPFYSAEIAAHPEYGLPSYLPGYHFTFTGQIDQFVKIYSTGARATNSYINLITSYFLENGVTITPQSKIQDMTATPPPAVIVNQIDPNPSFLN